MKAINLIIDRLTGGDGASALRLLGAVCFADMFTCLSKSRQLFYTFLLHLPKQLIRPPAMSRWTGYYRLALRG